MQTKWYFWKTYLCVQAKHHYLKTCKLNDPLRRRVLFLWTIIFTLKISQTLL
jgi:hypothetical protein